MGKQVLNYTFVKARFERIAKMVGWDTQYFAPMNVPGKCNVGAIILNRSGNGCGKVWYSLDRIVNPEGGESTFARSMSAAELIAFLDGYEYAKREA